MMEGVNLINVKCVTIFVNVTMNPQHNIAIKIKYNL
jgi:hypothetical protein